jgi:GTPase SAR1 family protein
VSDSGQQQEMGSLIIPGTTISLTLMPTYVEVRDKGVVKKKILLKDKSFDDVSLELQKYLRYLGKRLAPGILEDVLDRIGLPKARRVLKEPEPAPAPEPIQERPEPVQEAELIAEKTRKPPAKKTKEEKVAQFVRSPGVSADEKGAVAADDFDDIADALKAVEAMSDSFMAAGAKEEDEAPSPGMISIEVKGNDVVRASGNTFARAAEAEPKAPEPPSEEPEEVVLVAETIEEKVPEQPSPPHAEPVTTPEHQIKPLASCKALLLGEQGVGKKSLQTSANIEPIVINQESGEVSKHIFAKVFDLSNHRINLNVWSFDLAVKAKVSRKEFYENAHVLMIVYASSDRWSFESVDFWLREFSALSEVTPPIVIVGNKMDLRGEPLLGDESGEEPVSHEEGFKFAEDLAKRLGTEDKLHPVAFIETSCVTGENTEEAFRTAAQLFENTI